MAQLVFVPFSSGGSSQPVVEEFAGTARDMTSADDNKIIRCTNDNPITISVQAAQEPGTTAEFVAEGLGQITVIGAGGLVLLVPAMFNPATAQQYSSVVVTVLDADEALVRGDLEVV